MTAAELEAAGWRRMSLLSYSSALGPSWMIKRDGMLTIGLEAQEHLGNAPFGNIHGGAVMTFADMALGNGVGNAIGYDKHFVTAQLNVQFVSGGRCGEFITCSPEVVRETSSLVFVRGLIEANGRVVASADGIFKRLNPTRSPSIRAE